MGFTEDFFTSRRNYDDGASRVERPGTLWYYSEDNTLRVGDGSTPGGLILNTGGGGGGGTYVLPTASTTVKGGVKIDGTTIKINNQVISGFSGNYDDLANKPTIPTNTNQLTNNSGFITLSSLTWTNITNKPNFSTVATSGSYTDLSNLPNLFSGNYNDLTNKPTLFSGNYNDLTNKPTLAIVATTGNYNDLSNKPSLAVVATTGSYTDLLNRPSLFSGNYNDLTNKPTIPSNLNSLNDVVITSPVSGQVLQFNGTNWVNGIITWTDISSKPTFATVATTGSYTDLLNKPTIPAAQIQSDWNQTNNLSLDFIKNKPVLFSGNYNDLTNKPNLATVATTGSYNDLTNKPTLFSGNYNDLTNKPNLAGTYVWSISADDSTLITVNSGESIKIKGGVGISTSSDLEGNITITGFDGNYNSLTNRPTLSTVSYTGNYNDLINKPTLFSGNYNDLINKPNLAGTYTWNIAADDSTQRTINSGETLRIVGINGISTITDIEGNLTISGTVYDLSPYATKTYTDQELDKKLDKTDQYYFYLAGDDSTQRVINKSETIKFTGINGITTSTDIEGNLTITGTTYDLTPYATTNYVDTRFTNLIDGAPTLLDTLNELAAALNDDANFGGNIVTILNNKLDKDQQYKFSVAADDSTQRTISKDETVSFLGANGITTSSDSEGRITITGTTYDLTPYATISYANQELDKKLDKTQQYKFMISADDSTMVQVNKDENIQFVGNRNITTAINSEGKVTITGPDLSSYALITNVPVKLDDLIDVQLPATIPAGYVLKYDGAKWSAAADATVGGSGTDADTLDGFDSSYFLDYTNLNNRPDLYLQVAADDSTIRILTNNSTLQLVGANGINTSSSADGVITITGTTYDLTPYSTIAYVDQELDKKLDKGDQYKFSVSADDSTQRTIGTNETIKFIGGNGIDTASDSEGNITISASTHTLDSVTTSGNVTTNSISVGSVTATSIQSGNILPSADNSYYLGSASQRWHTLYVGPGSINIAGATISNINGTLAFGANVRFPDNTVQESASHFFIAGQDSTTVRINNGQTIKISGTSNIVTVVDADGNISLTGPDLSPFATTNYVDTRFTNLIDGAPNLLDTLNELSSALNDDANFATNVTTTLSNKLNISDRYRLYLAADDSTTYEIEKNSTVQLLGGTGITTSMDASGKITIDGFSGSYNDLVNKPSFRVSLINPTGTITEETTNVTALRFDTESAFDLTDLGNGEVKVQMNSTFKTWKVDGQQDLVATGLDTVEFVAGPGVSIETNPTAQVKSITFTMVWSSTNW